MKQGKASATAILVASGLLFASRSPRHPIFVRPEAVRLAEWLLGHYSPLTRRLLSVIGTKWFHGVVEWIEARTVPGIMEHYIRRKQAIELLARAELNPDADCLTILGAGFDTLAFHLTHAMPKLKALEIDHPATQQWKKRGVVDIGLECSNVDFIAEDLSEAFPESLAVTRRFWVAEGFLMYFAEDRVREIFRAIHRKSIQGSRIAFTFMEIQRNGRADFQHQSGWVNFWLAQRREPFSWGIDHHGLSTFLAPLGFRRVEMPASITREMNRLDVGELLALYEVVQI
jgi:methyltransferase (TIGR00027 family)